MMFLLALLACSEGGTGQDTSQDTNQDTNSTQDDSGNVDGDPERGLEEWGDEDVSSQGYVQSAAGDAHLCALDEAGTIWCWGPKTSDEKYYGQQEAPSGTWAYIKAGFFHSCALDSDGQATCWGNDAHGESTPPANVRFTKLALGSGASCGIASENGRIHCWGMRNFLTEGPKGDGFVNLDLDIWAGCAIASDGRLACWGNTEEGDKYNTGQVMDAPSATGFAAVGMGQYHGCASDAPGNVSCWGLDEDERISPPEGIPFVHLEGGDRHECGLTPEGIVHCWGTDGITRPTPEDQELIFLHSGWTFLSGIKPDGNLLNWGQENPYNTYMPGWVPDDMKF